VAGKSTARRNFFGTQWCFVLDELPEFKRTVLEVMRQPMEERRVTISRAKIALDFPASFMLIASMNPAPVVTSITLKENVPADLAWCKDTWVKYQALCWIE
jgi:predicted ATPase with chaperone activity